MNEVWKSIPGADGCMVSDMGRIRDKSGRIKPQDTDLEGYRRVSIKIEGRPLHLRVHTIVASVFIPNPYNKPFVNHINGIKTDNRAENLEWATPKENAQHAIRMGLISKQDYEKIAKAKYKKILQFDLDGNFIKEWASMKSIVEYLGISSNGNIAKCCSGKIKRVYGYIWKYK